MDKKELNQSNQEFDEKKFLINELKQRIQNTAADGKNDSIIKAIKELLNQDDLAESDESKNKNINNAT